MVSLSCDGIAVGFAFFAYMSSSEVFTEYNPLYMKQLGFSAKLIGLVSILGLLAPVGIPLIGFAADRFRARKLILFVILLLTIPNTLLFLAPRAPQQFCETSVMRYGSVENGTMPIVLLRKSGDSSFNRSSGIHRTEATLLVNKTITDHDHDADKAKDRLEFFLIFLFLRGMSEMLQKLTITFLNVSAMTHVKDDKTKYGFYFCWGEFGAGLMLFVVSIIAFQVQHLQCGEQVPGYYIAFLFTAGLQCLTLVSLPWLKYEYHERRVTNFGEVKKIIFNLHYILLLIICVHGGLCATFQMRWEFWYMEHLGGSAYVIATGGLVRHPIIALGFLLSGSMINRLGEMNVVAISLFLFSASFAALAFITNPWLVIVFDSFQAAAFALFFPAVVVHFSKAASKSSSAVIQGIVMSAFSAGVFIGSALTGWLFTLKGTTITLCSYSIVTLLCLAILMVHIFTAKDLDVYMQVPSEDETDDEKN